MFERRHHRRVATILQAFDAAVLAEMGCYFAGGTSIVMQLAEYRESLDADFLCASHDGYRALRETVRSNSLGRLLKSPLTLVRDVRNDRDAVRTFASVDGVPIKIELVREARITLSGSPAPILGVPTLSKTDLYAEKLLANADRGLDPGMFSRDLIDLAMMIDGWGPIPVEAVTKARSAYGKTIDELFWKAVSQLSEHDRLEKCLRHLKMDVGLADRITTALSVGPQSGGVDEVDGPGQR